MLKESYNNTLNWHILQWETPGIYTKHSHKIEEF